MATEAESASPEVRKSGSPDLSDGSHPPAIALVMVIGATASGKSALALALARLLGGEIVSADAMAVYRGLDIGTAKPSAADLAAVPHHLISVFEPGDRCDVGRWLALAETAIAGIHARGRLPIVAGGSPLYCKALIEGLSTGAPRDPAVRGALEAAYDADGGATLFAELVRVDPLYAAARHANDRKRVVRAMEVFRLTGRPFSSFHTTDGVRRTGYRVLTLGLRWDKAALHQRINRRARALFAAGLVEEVRALRHRMCPEAIQAVGYKEVIAHLDGEYDLARAQELVERNSRHLAKHQHTWYRRFHDVVWLPGDVPDLVDQANNAIRGFLAGAPPSPGDHPVGISVSPPP